ncbi:hypothetical protein [Shewanella surugensis]|uniref:Uncharacterized protein n=1 Tax=Shewanella surugensis TaxID=212020 RepID=A0ABT0LBB1_9GAMM|nr:hypothetical protein [Shewanella surugensis]MCL1124461.1 hypothetical protein [Shewanella surugensis]
MKAELGDLIVIPLAGRNALAHIVWISSQMKNVFGFCIFNELYIEGSFDIEKITVGDYLKIKMFSGDVSVLYGDIKNIKKNVWSKIGHVDLQSSYKEMIVHNIGGSLYEGDVFLRTLSSSEYSLFPKVLSAGNKAIENILAQSFK